MNALEFPLCLENSKVGSDSQRSGIHTNPFETLFHLPRPLQTLESVMSSTAFINPIKNKVTVDTLKIKNELRVKWES